MQEPEEFLLLIFRKRAEQLVQLVFSLVLQLAGTRPAFFRQGDQSRSLVRRIDIPLYISITFQVTDKLGHGRCVDPHFFCELFLTKPRTGSFIVPCVCRSLGESGSLCTFVLQALMIKKKGQDPLPGKNGRTMTMGTAGRSAGRTVRAAGEAWPFRT